ncbi:MAG: LuxR C-terminal-related transcriptional regulator [Spirochaetaceae bacterium]|jgi:DNA-binding NarL/FixJ family response regulator|nr:LuxR C-terminal-related transcriptional regulator [Spirochaetaceae bacterium]
MPKITVADYEKLLKFSFYINKNYDNFICNVQFALLEYFNFPLSVYTTFSKDHNGKVIVESIRGTATLAENLAKYRNYIMDDDLFIQRIPNLVQENPQRNIFTILDIASSEEFYSTKYGELLIEANNPYQVVIYGTITSPPPYHAVNVFKTKEHGDFTEYELKLLSLIGSIFNESLSLYKQYQENKNYINFLDVAASVQGFGLAVINEQGIIVYTNNFFVSIVSDMFNSESTVASVLAIDALLYEQTGMKINKIINPVTLRIGKHDFYFEPHCIAGVEGNLRFFFIFVDMKKVTHPSDPKLEFLDTYNMSAQEIEVAVLILQGFDNKKIAESLFINISTVKFHVRNILRKLGVNSRAAVITRFAAYSYENRSNPQSFGIRRE